VIVLAASPTKLHLMTSNNARGIILAGHLILIDTLDRENLQVEMHQRVTTRTAVITDSSTGHEYKIEGNRILFHHMNDVLDALAQTTTPTQSTRRLSSPIRSDRPAGLDSSLVVLVGGEREFVHHGTCRRSGTGPLRVGRCRRRGR